MNTQALQLFKKTKTYFSDAYATVRKIYGQSKAETDMEELADTVLALRKCEKYVNDLRKEVIRAKELCERLACMFWVQADTGDSIKTKYMTGTPTIKYMASLPKKRTDPEAYEKLMKYLNIDTTMYQDIEVVRPHWPGFVEFLSRLMAEGKPLPAGIDPDKTYPVYSLRVTKGKEWKENVA